MFYPRSCHLLELPAELRHQIFNELFQDARVLFAGEGLPSYPDIEDDSNPFTIIRHNLHVSILGTCKKLRHEAALVFWNVFELFIPSEMLWQSRSVGLWSLANFQKILSLRPQVCNVSVGIRGICGQRILLTSFTCFAMDLKHYSRLKRCTIVNTYPKEGSWISDCEALLFDEKLYMESSDKLRRKMWRDIQSPTRLFNEHGVWECFPYSHMQTWLPTWVPIFDLLMSWRGDPYGTAFFESRPRGRRDQNEHKGNNNMSFKFFYRFDLHVQFQKAVVDANGHNRGTLAPLSLEIEVIPANDKFDVANYQKPVPVGKYRHFWSQTDPPERLVDIQWTAIDELMYPFVVGFDFRSLGREVT